MSERFAQIGLTRTDLARVAALVERYPNLPLGAADASVVVVAERLHVTEVLTLDTRDFSVVRVRPMSRRSLSCRDTEPRRTRRKSGCR